MYDKDKDEGQTGHTTLFFTVFQDSLSNFMCFHCSLADLQVVLRPTDLTFHLLLFSMTNKRCPLWVQWKCHGARVDPEGSHCGLCIPSTGRGFPLGITIAPLLFLKKKGLFRSLGRFI